MLTKSKQRVFVPLLTMAFLLVGAFAAQAQEYRNDNEAGKGAAIGATVGTLFQLLQGRTAGHQLLKGAVVGGAVGAMAGAIDQSQRDRYDAYYDDAPDGYYPQDGAYDQDGPYYQDGYVAQGYYAAPNVYAYPYPSYGLEFRLGNDGYRHGGYARDSRRYDRHDRYEQHDGRSDRRAYHRDGGRHGRH
jgi:hypothetical protein